MADETRKVRPTQKQMREGTAETEAQGEQDPTLRASAAAPDRGREEGDTRPEATRNAATGAAAEPYGDDFPEAEKLRGAGLADKRAARAYVENGGDFTDIEGIGKAKAKQINAALGFEE